MFAMFAEEWIPVAEALERVDLCEADGREIVGLELATITADERVLLPAFADFSDCGPSESWAFARVLLTNHLPAEATHVSLQTA